MATQQFLQIERRAIEQPEAIDTGRFLTTVLVTDIVDSTSTVARLGDRRWRTLLAEHFADCRRQVSSGAGELVNTTGDGIVAIFRGPTCAVRTAIAIQTLARASGIAVRAGVHTGECERLGDDVAGVTVHIAARICALAGADEVMATGTVRDLALGSMLAFEPRGREELKGLPGEWVVFSATDPQVGVGAMSLPPALPVSVRAPAPHGQGDEGKEVAQLRCGSRVRRGRWRTGSREWSI
jgi:class 3 adenylate cyclase